MELTVFFALLFSGPSGVGKDADRRIKGDGLPA